MLLTGEYNALPGGGMPPAAAPCHKGTSMDALLRAGRYLGALHALGGDHAE